MQTHFLELPDYYMLINRINIYLISFDAKFDCWIIKEFGKESTYYFDMRDKNPMAYL